jgi:hypothetical protein
MAERFNAPVLKTDNDPRRDLIPSKPGYQSRAFTNTSESKVGNIAATEFRKRCVAELLPDLLYFPKIPPKNADERPATAADFKSGMIC